MKKVRLLNLAKVKLDKEGKHIPGTGEIKEMTEKEFERFEKSSNYREYFLLIEEN